MSQIRERWPPQGIAAAGVGVSGQFYPFEDPDLPRTGRNPGYPLVQGVDITVAQEIYLPFTPSAVYAVVIPGGTGNINRGVNTDASAQGEVYNTHTGTIAAGNVAVTINEREFIDITAAFAGFLDGDLVGVEFTRYGTVDMAADALYLGILVVP